MPQAKSSARATVSRNTSKDLTAKQQKEAEEKVATEKAEAAEKMSLATEAQKEADQDELVNYTDEDVSEEELESVGAKKVTEVTKNSPKEKTTAVRPKEETIRARETVEFTLGVGNRYAFEAGKAYKIPTPVADHMREKGLLW